MKTTTSSAPVGAVPTERSSPDWAALFQEHRHWLLPLVPLLLVMWGPIVWAVKTWSAPYSPQAYQPLVPFAAGFLAWLKRKELAGIYARTKDRPRGSLLLVIVGCALLLLSHGTQIVSLSFVAFIITLAGIIHYIYGPAILRAMTTPMLFLLTMVPLPGFLVDRPTQELQIGSTKVTGHILERVGIPAYAKGNTLITDKYTLEVVAACSGMGILLPLFVMTLWLLLIMEGRLSQKVFVLFAAFWIALLMNVLRVTATALIGQIDKETADILHDTTAWTFTALAFYITYLAARAIGINKLCSPISD